MRKLRYSPAAIVLPLFIACAAWAHTTASKPIALGKGPHLLLDDHLIARSTGVERKVIPPQRFLDGPIVTGALEHQNWQPFLTVLHDSAAAPEKRFRMWYNVDVVDDPKDGEWFGIT